MNYREATIEIQGRQTRLLRGGQGVPLVYLHDTFRVRDLWLPLHDQLAGYFEVILPLHPGCEGSEATDIETMEDLVFHYLDLCEALQLERPVVVGASLGGWIAAEWAVRYADKLRGLVLLDALGLRVPEAPAADILRLDAAQTRNHVFADPAADLAQQVIPDVPPMDDMSAFLQARQTLARFAWQFPDNPRLLRYLYRITIPTLIVWGAQDGFIPGRHGEAYQSGIADAELTVLPQCGHLPQVEQADACCRAVLDFLRRRGIACDGC